MFLSALRPAWTRSLRFRLTIWYSGALALVLLAAALLVYFGASHALSAETDGFLTLEARRLSGVVRGQPNDPPEASDLAEAVEVSTASPALPRGPGHSAPKLLLFDVTYLRIVSRASGRTLAASANLARQPVLVSSLDRLLAAKQITEAGAFSFAGPSEEQEMRVLTEPALVGAAPVWVQAAVPWDHNADVLERLGRLLILGVPLVLAACGAGGWLLVGRTLQPIARIVSEAERLDADALPRALLPEASETDSEIGHLVATLNRMTTRLHGAWEAQRRFAEAQQRFAADASHELRTPLTILRGEMELALSRPRSLETYQATIGSAVEEIDRMSRIVAGLGFLARRDAGQMGAPSLAEPVDLSALCRTVIADFHKQARDKEVELTLHAPSFSRDSPPLSDGLWASGNRDQLQQLLGNLMDNALNYTPPGGAVLVFVERSQEGSGDQRAVLLCVADTGIGIAAHELPHVFERFWRADRARPAGGSGLGLAICAQIAQAHGGTLSVESELGRGSQFCLRLPAWAGPAQPERDIIQANQGTK